MLLLIDTMHKAVYKGLLMKRSLPFDLSDEDQALISAFFKKSFPGGSFTAKEVLELAKPKNSPIHRFFTWDDARAAAAYRLREAQRLISCVVVIINDEPTRKYVSPVVIEGYEKPQYCEIEKALSDKSIWSQVLARALEAAELWNLRYKHLKELSPISNSIERTKKKLKRKGAVK